MVAKGRTNAGSVAGCATTGGATDEACVAVGSATAMGAAAVAGTVIGCALAVSPATLDPADEQAVQIKMSKAMQLYCRNRII